MKKFFRFLAVAGAMAFSANFAFAQDEMSAADLLSGSGEQPLNQALKQKFIEGGPAFMSLIIICLIIGLALAIERILYLSFSKINTKRRRYREGEGGLPQHPRSGRQHLLPGSAPLRPGP